MASRPITITYVHQTANEKGLCTLNEVKTVSLNTLPPPLQAAIYIPVPLPLKMKQLLNSF